MNKKKVIIITSSVLGAIVLGFVAYRVASRWNKEVINDGNTTILISKEEPNDVEVVDSTGDDTGELKEIIYPEDLKEFDVLSGMGDY
jgi:hypothetical protein